MDDTVKKLRRLRKQIQKDANYKRQQSNIYYAVKDFENNHERYIYYDWKEEEASEIFESCNVSSES